MPSVDKFTKRVEANGGKIIRPKSAVIGVGYMTYFEDPEGNVFGMMESDESAK